MNYRTQEHRASEQRKGRPMIGASEGKKRPSDEDDERLDWPGRADWVIDDSFIDSSELRD
jgi:hypothetical protein